MSTPAELADAGGSGAAAPAPGERLCRLVAALGVRHGFERSIKLRQGRILENRCLLTVTRSSLGKAPDPILLDLCRRLNMSPRFIEEAGARLPDATIVHFGFEEETPERRFYKCYLEFQERFERAVRASDTSEPVPVPFPLHLAFKWNVDDHAEQVVARYLAYPQLEREAILQRVAQIYARQSRRTPWDVTCRLLAAASRSVPARDLLYLEVEEEGTSRRSFDLNVYPAGFPAGAMAPFLAGLSAHFGVRSSALHDAFAPHLTRPLGHVAGGVDRQGRDFFTVYFGVEGRG